MKVIHIPTLNGNLEGILHEAENPKADRVFIISHGFNGSIDGTSKAEMLGEEIRRLGFHVLRYKFTPCQKLSSQIAELSAVVRYARENIASRVYLLGRSMGGSASLAYAYLDKAVEALCLWATPGDLHETFKQALGEDYDTLSSGKSVTFSDETGSITLGPDFIRDFDQYSLFQYVSELPNVPVLILHGNKDQVVPVHQAHTMYQAALEPKKLVIIESGDHQFTHVADQARAAVIQWLSQICE